LYTTNLTGSSTECRQETPWVKNLVVLSVPVGEAPRVGVYGERTPHAN